MNKNMQKIQKREHEKFSEKNPKYYNFFFLNG